VYPADPLLSGPIDSAPPSTSKIHASMWARYFRFDAMASALPSARKPPRRFVSVPPSVTRLDPVPSGRISQICWFIPPPGATV
jgi:hypothetical protein